MIRRRGLIGMAATCGLATPYGAIAQRTGKLPRVAFVFNTAPLAEMTGLEPVHSGARQFVHGLRDLGYVEGRNIVIEHRSAEGRPVNFGLWREIIDFAARRRLPAIYEDRLYAEGGGLMSYGPVDEQYRRLATYVDKILKGAKLGDLPIEQPMRFELIINLKTATSLGLTIPYSLLVRADQAIR
jgi:hypothetical protein